jgi:hypothetical protein|tara:strand:- start:922 stop:3348 length:2427 start_codon:yes stop_codon:yes gene_type:complete
MAERIVSPGVFTREKDLSFLPQAIGEIGAAIIGPTKKGPAFTPTQISNFQEFEEMFGGVDNRFYTPYTVEQYLRSAGTVTVVRVVGLGGYKVDSLELLAHGSSQASRSIAILAPSRGSSGTGDLSASSVAAGASWSSFTLTVSGSDVSAETYSLSFDTSSANFVSDVISSDPQSTKSGGNSSSVYVYKMFKNLSMNTSGSSTSNISASTLVTSDGLDFQGGATSFNSKGNASTFTGNKDYMFARTPTIQSQTVGGQKYSLFRVYSRSHGTDINTSYKIKILSIKPATDVAGSDYGQFSIHVVDVSNDGTLEEFDNLTLDPASPSYFAKRIGDRWVEIDTNGKLTYYGNYPNLSKFIRVGDFSDMEEDGVFRFPKSVVPFGHAVLSNPSPGGTRIPSASFKITQTDTNGTFDASVPYGIDLLTKYIKEDNMQYLAPIANSANAGNNVTMSLSDMFGNNDFDTSISSTYTTGSSNLSLADSATQQLKFVVPFQWGFDGRNPATPYYVGSDIVNSNTQGFDCQSSTASGSIAYKRAINAISNPDEFDINLLVTPGVIHGLHSSVTNHAISKVESRADAFYILDAAGYGDSISTVKATIKTVDTNYAGTYYPWVKIEDRDTSRPVWVPPSVVLPGTIAYTDKVAHEWFAPAGLNRGGLTTVLEAKTKLTHAERDDLYENRINPIASFPGQGVVVFGQKTLQSKPSALDRINVRRLLIAMRKFIASASRYLVFEQNSQALRNRFLNIVNPYLEQVQQNSGLSAFRVVMDESNNTPDVIDRNQLVGQIFIQPTRTAEFIVLDFIVQPTGAAFPE